MKWKTYKGLERHNYLGDLACVQDLLDLYGFFRVSLWKRHKVGHPFWCVDYINKEDAMAHCERHADPLNDIIWC